MIIQIIKIIIQFFGEKNEILLQKSNKTTIYKPIIYNNYFSPCRQR